MVRSPEAPAHPAGYGSLTCWPFRRSAFASQAESITEGTLKEFHKAVGDFVKADEEVA